MKKRKSKKFLLLVIIIIFSIFPIVSKAKGNSGEYTTVTVRQGDTLWSIASSYNTYKDIRKTVYAIRKVNKLDSAIIIPGQELMIPCK